MDETRVPEGKQMIESGEMKATILCIIKQQRSRIDNISQVLN